MMRLVFVGAVLCGTGCYRYTPMENPQPGVDVRVRLNTQAAVQRSEGLDEAVMVFNGLLVEAAPDAITLDVLVARDPSQFSNVEIRNKITLQRSEVQSITVRELSTGRSVLFAGAVAAGAFVIVRGISSVVGGSEGEDPGNGTQTAVISLFRLQQSGRGVRLQLPFR